MITVTCDNCNSPIDRDTDEWYGLDHTEAAAPVHPDPVQAMNDAEDYAVATLSAIGLAGEHKWHFCSMECIAGWAFGEGMNL